MSVQRRLPIGLIGYGYWGPNLLRNLIAHGGFDILGIADLSEKARQACAKTYPFLRTHATVEGLLALRPEMVVIATPPPTHCRLAVQCMEAGAEILVEKPMALSVAECDVILESARKLGRRVMVDHTFVYHSAIRYIYESLKRGDLGAPLYYDSVRINLGGFQAGTNVLWDLAPHDLSILDHLLDGQLPESVSVTGARHFEGSNESLCHVHLAYPGGFIAHLHVNWFAPVKVRTIIFGGTKKMVVYDDNLPTEKVKIYDKGVTFDAGARGDHGLRVSYRMGDMTAPALSAQEALADMVSAFHRFGATGERTISDGDFGRRIVQILEAGSISLRENGRKVPLAEASGADKSKLRSAA